MPRRGLGSIPTALFVTLGLLGVAPHSLAQATGHASALAGQPRSQAAPLCTIAQVRFTYFGGDGAAGTAVTEIAATDLSSRACVLRGYPKVQFYGGSILNWRAFSVQINHTGPGIAFSPNPKAVLLEPDSPGTSGATQVAFVITTADFAVGGSGTCPQATSIEVGFAPALHMDRVPLWYPTNICGASATASVSAFFAGSPQTYVMPAIAPICAASQLAVTASSDGVAMSHYGLVLRFRNFGFIPCRMAGYPSVDLLGTGGARIATAAKTPAGYLGGLTQGTGPPPLVTLQPGQYASSLLEDDYGGSGTKRDCAGVVSLLVTAPFATHSTRIATRLDGCGHIEVHPILAGTKGGAGN